MAKDVKNCQACEDLTEYAPEFVANGVTSTICTSLKNNTGFNPSLSKQHENCEDLDDANDCLIGNMVDEGERFDVCDWKAYARLFAANIYNVLKAIICSMCGLWNNIKSIKKSITNIQSQIDCVKQLAVGGKELSSYFSNLQAGTGIRLQTTGSAKVDMLITGGSYRLQGQFRVWLDGYSNSEDMSNFWGSKGIRKRTSDGNLVPRGTPDADGYNSGYHHGTSNSNNSYFITDPGNWTVATLLIPKTAIPQVAYFYYGVGQVQDMGMCQLTAQWGDGDDGDYLSGQWGTHDTDSRVQIPEGYFGVKIGMSSIMSWDGYTTDEDTGRTYCTCTFNIMGMYKGKSNASEIIC